MSAVALEPERRPKDLAGGTVGLDLRVDPVRGAEGRSFGRAPAVVRAGEDSPALPESETALPNAHPTALAS